MNHNKKKLKCTLIFAAVFFSMNALAEIERVRVVNESNSTIYIHTGGYASSSRIETGDWKIFYFPFSAHPPGQLGKEVKTTLLVATAGGHWVTRPNGFTYLDKPNMMICLDYAAAEHRHKTGNRIWTIKQASGFDEHCQLKGYQRLPMKKI